MRAAASPRQLSGSESALFLRLGPGPVQTVLLFGLRRQRKQLRHVGRVRSAVQNWYGKKGGGEGIRTELALGHLLGVPIPIFHCVSLRLVFV